MGDLVAQANSQAGQIRASKASLQQAERDVDTYLQKLKTGWKAPEMQYIEQAVAQVKKKIAQASLSLDHADSTLVRVANQIEDEERRQAELAAQALAERQKQATRNR
ncbi:hypothetical protein ACFQZE_14825 [Paenibacillus sp. GCM10027627]|uniref:hypothetical protein n=1 Tax=unclassified Paenibacillus TaxID=185978 RepID=UPI00362BADC9